MLEAASAQSQRNYQISALVFISMIIVAAIYISSALWWTRKMIVQPLVVSVAILTALLRVIWRVRLRCMVAMRSPPFCQSEDHAAGFAWDGK